MVTSVKFQRLEARFLLRAAAWTLGCRWCAGGVQVVRRWCRGSCRDGSTGSAGWEIARAPPQARPVVEVLLGVQPAAVDEELLHLLRGVPHRSARRPPSIRVLCSAPTQAPLGPQGGAAATAPASALPASAHHLLLDARVRRQVAAVALAVVLGRRLVDHTGVEVEGDVAGVGAVPGRHSRLCR
jgi:hypothetical protein